METPTERALEILEAIKGEGGYNDLVAKFQESIEDKKNKILLLKGEVAGLQTSLLVLQAIHKEWNLGKLDLAIRDLKVGDQPLSAALPTVQEMKAESQSKE